MALQHGSRQLEAARLAHRVRVRLGARQVEQQPAPEYERGGGVSDRMDRPVADGCTRALISESGAVRTLQRCLCCADLEAPVESITKYASLPRMLDRVGVASTSCWACRGTISSRVLWGATSCCNAGPLSLSLSLSVSLRTHPLFCTPTWCGWSCMAVAARSTAFSAATACTCAATPVLDACRSSPSDARCIHRSHAVSVR